MYAKINPALLIWAVKRSGKSIDSLKNKFPKISEWIEGVTAPTLKQLESFANSTYAPIDSFSARAAS